MSLIHAVELFVAVPIVVGLFAMGMVYVGEWLSLNVKEKD